MSSLDRFCGVEYKFLGGCVQVVGVRGLYYRVL